MSLSPAQWSNVQEVLKGKLGEEDFNSWLSPLTLASSNEETITLAVPSPFMQDWVDQHYGQIIRSTVADTAQKDVQLKYVVQPDGGRIEFNKPVAEAAPVAPATPEASAATLPSASRLDPRYKFENFVTGKSNSFAFAAAQRITEGYDPNYNPFFMYGGVGLGKTHLMHAIGWKILENRPETKILYLSSEQFLNRMVKAIQTKSTLSFKEECRSVDVLMIDDIQFFAGKNNTQEEFFNTFNALREMNKQIILTADRSPHDLTEMDDRLRSRLGAGLTCQIHTPEMETRLAILNRKADELQIQLSENVAFFLADGINSNVRELEGALNRLAAHVKLTGARLTLDLAQEQLRDLFRANARLLTLDDIQKKVAEYYHIRIADLHGARRLRSIARPRQVAMYLAKKLTTKSYPDIGRSFGGRDHTTVIHAVRTIENLLPREPQLNEDVQLLEKMLTTR